MQLRMNRLERELREEISTVRRAYNREIVLYRQPQPPARR
jgi:hypothetical protein